MTKAFDSAMFIPPNPNAGEVVEIASPGPPLQTQFNTYVGGPPGVMVEASVPAATGQGQSLISGPGPDFDWEAAPTSSTLPVPTGPNQTYVSEQSSPFAMQLAPSTPQATAPQQVLLSGGALGPFPWTLVTVPQLMTAGNAVTTTVGGLFTATASLVFTPSAGLSTCIDGSDPTKSAINNFTIDAGTF
jgi:hypothetical protein